MRELFEEAVKDYLNNDFGGATGDSLPAGVRIAIDKLMQSDKNRESGVSTKSQGDMITVSFAPETWSSEVRTYLRPFRKMRF